jgi:hypothetical protein
MALSRWRRLKVVVLMPRLFPVRPAQLLEKILQLAWLEVDTRSSATGLAI